MSVIVRNIAESRTAVGKNLGGGQNRYRSRRSDCRNPQSVDGKVVDENAFPPTSRVSAEARDQNQ